MGCFFLQAEDGIRDLVRSRGLGDVYKRQGVDNIMKIHSLNPTSLINHFDLYKTLMRGKSELLSLIHI